MCSAVSPMAPGIDRKKSHAASAEQGDGDNRGVAAEGRRSGLYREPHVWVQVLKALPLTSLVHVTCLILE